MLSEKYCEMTSAIGTMENSALTGMGISAVTVRSTGRETHQNTIQSSVPTAWAPGPPNTSDSPIAHAANNAGPMMR